MTKTKPQDPRGNQAESGPHAAPVLGFINPLPSVTPAKAGAQFRNVNLDPDPLPPGWVVRRGDSSSGATPASTSLRRNFLIGASAFAAFPASWTFAQEKLDAPNVVPISDLWTTSGQPTAAALAGLAARGFQSVIYLAPPTVDSAVKEEPAILAKQGVDYHNIPIPFGAPAEKHFDDFVAAMRLYGKQKLLVHCEVNMRASCMMFLYRTIIRKVPVETAYESVTKVWTPRFAWKPYVESTLARHGIKFEVY